VSDHTTLTPDGLEQGMRGIVGAGGIVSFFLTLPQNMLVPPTKYVGASNNFRRPPFPVTMSVTMCKKKMIILSFFLDARIICHMTLAGCQMTRVSYDSQGASRGPPPLSCDVNSQVRVAVTRVREM